MPNNLKETVGFELEHLLNITAIEREIKSISRYKPPDYPYTNYQCKHAFE